MAEDLSRRLAYERSFNQTVTVVEKLIEAVPELAESYREHLSDNGSPLPYMYLPDAVRALELGMQLGTCSEDVLDRLSVAIEEVLKSADSDVRDLVCLGLLVEINYKPSLVSLLERLGPEAKRELSEYLAWTPSEEHIKYLASKYGRSDEKR